MKRKKKRKRDTTNEKQSKNIEKKQKNPLVLIKKFKRKHKQKHLLKENNSNISNNVRHVEEVAKHFFAEAVEVCLVVE